jgi:N-acetylglucosaminyldiphosphoundecaprenol N-acetyl-beta-D-mannosaminyltransferase
VEIDDSIAAFLGSGRSHQIATINPEFLYKALHDEDFRDVLNAADLHVIDGFGVVCAFLWHKQRVQCRTTGVELMWQILDHADRGGHSIFLAVNAFGLTAWKEMRDAIRMRYPQLTVTGADMDPTASQIDPEIRADIILCNFGAPHQENFLFALKKRNAYRIGVGIGGAFDFATGKITRAPRWLRRCGCEWLWRLICQPRRWRRIVRAVIFFPWCVVRGK